MNSKTVNGVKGFLFLVGLMGVAVSAQGASFECGKAGTKLEKMICDNPEISNLDDGMAAAYKATLQEQAQPELVIQAQKKWLKARNNCKDAGCVKKAYMSRLAVLEGVTEETLDRRKQDANRFGDIGTTGYEFKLEVSNNDKVCNHMSVVYNQYFNHPFAASAKPEDYAEGGQYALPLLPGVQRDPRLSIKTRRSLQPTSPEFDAVRWQEGRYRHIYMDQDGGDQEMLVAQLDIDNDGFVETVIKESFMEGYLPSHRSMLGGEDSLSIFRAGELDLGMPIQLNTFYEGQDGHQLPAHLIGASYGFPYRLMRLFNFDGVNYLSAYRQVWPKVKTDPYQMPDKEYMEVLQYRSGGDNLGKGKWSLLKIDTICQFRMTAGK